MSKPNGHLLSNSSGDLFNIFSQMLLREDDIHEEFYPVETLLQTVVIQVNPFVYPLSQCSLLSLLLCHYPLV